MSIDQKNDRNIDRNSDGKLCMSQHDLESVVNEFGSPLFVYDGDSIYESTKQVLKALSDQVGLFYSVKANPNIAICALLKEAGVNGAEVASSGELLAAIESGFKPEQILFAGPGKTTDELELAISLGVHQINAESVTEIQRIESIASSLGNTQRVGVRVNPESSSSGQGKILTAGGPRKFGIDESKVSQAVTLITQSSHLEFAGLHTMLGSQVLDAQVMIESCNAAIEMSIRIANQSGSHIPSLNFGGGLGAAHTDDDQQFDVIRFSNDLESIVRAARQHPELADCKFMIEPGRALVSEHGVYLARVIDRKESCGQTFAILDGGIHHALLPITANAYRITNASRPDISRKNNTPVHPENAAQSESKNVILGGPLCTSADQWRSQVHLPGFQIGDVIAMHNSGAYGLTASMNMFLSRGIPAEVLIHQDHCYLIRERSRPTDFLMGQHIPQHIPQQKPAHTAQDLDTRFQHD
ncbi:MAG: diaminopimelate decarboxylase [Phycisphaerales bacterium]